MEYSYLYIDDNSKDVMYGTITGIKEENYLNIICENPVGNWEEQRENILARQHELDGLILDLRLEDFKNEQNKTSFFKGTTLAQELRTLSKENSFKEIPIVLLSATANITSSFDSTGSDLFDLIIHKDKLIANEHPIRKKQLFSLAKGYRTLKSIPNGALSERLAFLFGAEVNFADIRFQQRMISNLDKTSHDLARFILREFIEKDGILVCEQTLAARLGINFTESPDWIKLLNRFDSYLYKGVFCDGWQLWWANGIEKWWNEELNEQTDLRYLKSDQRVSIIKTKVELEGLIPITKGSFSNSTLFWNICLKTKKPLDPIESILAAGQENLYPWQDRIYVSLEQALYGPKTDLSPLEWERVEKLKNFHSRERVRREQK